MDHLNGDGSTALHAAAHRCCQAFRGLLLLLLLFLLLLLLFLLLLLLFLLLLLLLLLLLVSRTLVARDSCHFWTSQSRQVRSGLLSYGLGWGGMGWGGVGMMTFFELEHMVDAMWKLRNSVCLVTAHMVDATQLCLSCHCTHGGCYATLCVLSLHSWWMLGNSVCLELAR